MKPIEVVVPPRCRFCFFDKIPNKETWYCYFEPTRKSFDEPCSKYDEGICPRARGKDESSIR